MKISLQDISNAVENVKLETDYGEAVRTYAYELITDAREHGFENVENEYGLEQLCLNGASDLADYNMGGCSLCYTGDIVERLKLKRDISDADALKHQYIALTNAMNLVKLAFRIAKFKNELPR